MSNHENLEVGAILRWTGSALHRRIRVIAMRGNVSRYDLIKADGSVDRRSRSPYESELSADLWAIDSKKDD